MPNPCCQQGSEYGQSGPLSHSDFCGLSFGPYEPLYVEIGIEKTTFTCNNSRLYGIYLKHMPVAKVSIERSTIAFCQIQLQVSDLFLNIFSSKLYDIDGYFSVESRWNVPTWILISESNFYKTKSSTLPPIKFTVNSPYVKMDIAECKFYSMSISIELEDHFYMRSKAVLMINKSEFHGASKRTHPRQVMVEHCPFLHELWMYHLRSLAAPFYEIGL